MADLVQNIYFLILVSFSVLFIYLSYIFYKEQESLASRRSLYIALALSVYVLISYLFFPEWLIQIDFAGMLILLFPFFFPFKINKNLTHDQPFARYDERDIMFSRKELIPGSEKYNNYYLQNPGKEARDMQFRKEAGLLSSTSLFYHKIAFRAAKSFFNKIDSLVPQIHAKPSSTKTEIDPLKASKDLKQMAIKLGAIDAGITVCKSYHFYSHKGRGDQYGKEINIKHQFALAFTVEMDQDMVAAAPKASIVMESARQYLNAAEIALKLSQEIRLMGYDARAHIDGNYELICPLVARDAGLGEIGRMGILMTPDKGPRVRIGVLTTKLELIPDKYIKNHALLDFCNRCKKCAECCPSRSIPFSEPLEIEGVKRWKIDSESCFTYWCKAGTDCGRCMAVCPYSHPNNSIHKMIRWGIQHSTFFRIIAVYMDDVFYSRKPKPKNLPEDKIQQLSC